MTRISLRVDCQRLVMLVGIYNVDEGWQKVRWDMTRRSAVCSLLAARDILQTRASNSSHAL